VVSVVLGVVALAAVNAVRDEPGPPRLTGSSPADGAEVAAPPVAVSLTFSGRVDPGAVHVRVSRANGVAAASGTPTLDGRRVVVPVTVVDRGGYLIGYHVVLASGREVAGVVRFTVAAAGAAAAAPEPARPVHDPGGHAHGVDALSLVLLSVNAGLIAALVWAMCRPRTRDTNMGARPQ
jgi:copper resistance protein C